jgi:hypothetical protein
MATLILSAVGSAVGGPVGGMIGSIVGQYVDQTLLFAPKPRHGPRLGDLSVQTSSYGTAIPKIFGRMRVAGCVIWATDLVETRSTSGGGKGQPKVVSYNYSANFAVALSARPIRSVRRIWADGKLLRGAAGDFKSSTGFRLYPGDEDQAVDPLIASAEGGDRAPAFRGVAYAVFENLALADYGNRIPSLTFEIEADTAPVPVGAIAEELSGGAVLAQGTPAVTGYAAGGDSVRSAVQTLADIIPLSLADHDGKLVLAASGGSPKALAAEDECSRRQVIRRAAVAVPDEVSLTYYDPDRDFQNGLQRATAGNPASARTADRRALPAALEASAAKGFAELRLAALWAGRTTAKAEFGWRQATVRPGETVQLQGEPGRWRVNRWTLRAATLDLEMSRLAAHSLPQAGTAAPGRPVSEPDLPHGATILHLFELPLGGPRDGRPLLFAAAAGPSAGWRRAGLLASFDGGASWEEAGATAAPATVGEALSALSPAGSTLFDDVTTVDVEVVNDSMWLENAADEGLATGSNLALLGDELIQFGRAQWLGGRRFRLSRLLRGRRGTEWAAQQHGIGERFVLVEKATLALIEAPAGSSGGEVRLNARSVGDADGGVAASLVLTAESLRPPPPVHFRGERLTNGDILLRWVRRSRHGWAWSDGGDIPLGEEREAYRVAISGPGLLRTAATAEPAFLYAAALQAEDGAAGPLQFAVEQIGTHAASRAAILNLF